MDNAECDGYFEKIEFVFWYVGLALFLKKHLQLKNYQRSYNDTSAGNFGKHFDCFSQFECTLR